VIRDIGDGELVELLAAYQFLQAQNLRMTSGLTSHLGIGSTDLRVLLYVDRAPDATPKEVAVQLKQTSGSITALLDRLEKSGHIVRRPHPSDRRSLTLALTESGREVVREVRAAYRSAFSGVFSASELSGVADTLRALAGALDPAASALLDTA
jgi:DNA-binding MarR family transcriptional regulator